MATLYDGGGASKTESQAEFDLKTMFERKLDPSYTIIHSVPWIAQNPRAPKPKGEVDFVIAHPNYGILLLEVKGGQIEVERNHWFSIDRFGNRNELRDDPFVQADGSIYPIKGWLSTSQHTKKFTYPVFHAVAFPDTGIFPIRGLRPDAPAEIVIDGSRVASPQKAIEEIFAYWKTRYPGIHMGGRPAVDALVKLMVPTADLSTSLAEAFRREGRQIDALTQEQFDVFKNLRHQNRAAIVGGAGTGKTLLAMEKARRLVDQEKKHVLLVCFNSNLAAWIADKLRANGESLLEVCTFHQLAERMIRRSKLPTDPRMKDFMERAADLLQDSLERLRQKPTAQADLYDAVIIDEGQDFRDEWWIPIPDLLKDPDNGLIYIFFDDNQRLYNQLGNIPFDVPPFVLFRNCRNTQKIFATLKPYLPLDDETECVGPSGRPVQKIEIDEKTNVSEELHEVLKTLTSGQIK